MVSFVFFLEEMVLCITRRVTYTFPWGEERLKGQCFTNGKSSSGFLQNFPLSLSSNPFQNFKINYANVVVGF